MKKRNETIWVLVADRSRARILSLNSHAEGKPLVVRELEYEDGQKHQHDTVTDRQGYFAGGGNGSMEACEPTTDFKHQTAERFSRELIGELEKGRQQGDFDRLVVAAAPLMLGVLRDHYPSPLAQTVALELNKDYTHLKPEEVVSHLPESL